MSKRTGKNGYLALQAYLDDREGLTYVARRARDPRKKGIRHKTFDIRWYDDWDYCNYRGRDMDCYDAPRSMEEWIAWYLYRNAKLPVEERDSDYEFFRYAEELGMDPWSEEYLHCEYPAHMDVIDTRIKMLRIRRAIRLWVENRTGNCAPKQANKE